MPQEKKKPGVMIYFAPMREHAETLSDDRLARLFRAILAYADPDCGQEPDFHDDEVLRQLWIDVRYAIIRDDNTYHLKNQKKQYAVFCRFAKENGFSKENDQPPISREEWEMLGCPTFSEWKRTEVMQADTLYTGAYRRIQNDTAYTGAYSRMQNDTGVSNRMPTSPSTAPSSSATPPTAFSPSTAPSTATTASETEIGLYAQTRTASAPLSPLPGLAPEMHRIFDEWITHKAGQGKELSPQSQSYIAEDFKTNAAEYGIDAIEALVREAITNGWKTLYFEKLKENPSRYDPRRFPPRAASQNRQGQQYEDSEGSDMFSSF